MLPVVTFSTCYHACDQPSSIPFTLKLHVMGTGMRYMWCIVKVGCDQPNPKQFQPCHFPANKKRRATQQENNMRKGTKRGNTKEE